MTFEADKERLAELHRQQIARGVTISQWNLAGADEDLPKVLNDIVELQEKIEAGNVEFVDPATLG